MISLTIILVIWVLGTKRYDAKVDSYLNPQIIYTDANNLIVQKNGDGGDTAGREGDYWFFAGLTKSTYAPRSLINVLSHLQVSPGIFIRNPTKNPTTPPAKSWNDPTDFSRDQTSPMILALGAMEQYSILKNLLWHQIKRFGFYQNHDLPSPEDLGAYIRSFKAWYLYPVLWVTDCFLFGETVIRIYAPLTDVSDDINHTLRLLQAQYIYPTLMSLLARKVYKTYRNVQGAWDLYFDPSSGANPFNKIYEPLIKRM